MLILIILGLIVFCVIAFVTIGIGVTNRNRYFLPDKEEKGFDSIRYVIFCLIILFFGLGLLIGIYSGLAIDKISYSIEESNRSRLLILYNITED